MSKDSKNQIVRVGAVADGDFSAVVKEVKVKPGVWVSKGQIVVTVILEGSTAATKVRSEASGKVVKVQIRPNDQVKKETVICNLSSECSHPTIMKDMCAECGVDLRQDEPQVPLAVDKSYSSMVHCIPELRVNTEEAQTLGLEDETRLRKHKKLVLLVDLDQTVIHTTNEDIQPNLKNVYHFQLYGSRSPWYHTRIRPHTMEFLEKISTMYELHICTFGARRYAHEIASFLDPKGKYFSHRILSRDECFDARSKTANLSSLFPRGDHMVCIIDDREDVWKYAPNLVHVKPYNFFKSTGDINAPPGLPDPRNPTKKGPSKQPEAVQDNKTKKDKPDAASKEGESEKEENLKQVEDDLELSDDEDSQDQPDEKKNEDPKTKTTERGSKTDGEDNKKSEKEGVDDDLVDVEEEDDYLLYLEEILRTIHRAYYDMYEQTQEENKDPPDLKTVIPYVRRKTLKGLNLCFSGVVPKHVKLEKSKAYLVAKSLGANVSEKLIKEGDDKTTHLIAALDGTQKLGQARQLGKIHIVTPDWLWTCAERWEKVEETLFPFSKQKAVTLKPPAHCSSPEIAFAERCANSSDSLESSNPLPEVMNPRLAFSSDELAVMDKEIDDVLSEEDDDDDDDDDDEDEDDPGESDSVNQSSSLKRKLNRESSSDDSADELSPDEPKGWSKARKRFKEDDSDDEDAIDADADGDDDEELANMARDLEEYMDESNLE